MNETNEWVNAWHEMKECMTDRMEETNEWLYECMTRNDVNELTNEWFIEWHEWHQWHGWRHAWIDKCMDGLMHAWVHDRVN